MVNAISGGMTQRLLPPPPRNSRRLKIARRRINQDKQP
jgi:hypothetical protein